MVRCIEDDDHKELTLPPCNPGVLFACSRMPSSSSSSNTTSDDDDDDDDNNTLTSSTKTTTTTNTSTNNTNTALDVRHGVLLIDSWRQLGSLAPSMNPSSLYVHEEITCAVLREVTAYEQYLHSIEEKEYGYAQSLAKLYHFDTDILYVLMKSRVVLNYGSDAFFISNNVYLGLSCSTIYVFLIVIHLNSSSSPSLSLFTLHSYLGINIVGNNKSRNPFITRPLFNLITFFAKSTTFSIFFTHVSPYVCSIVNRLNPSYVMASLCVMHTYRR